MWMTIFVGAMILVIMGLSGKLKFSMRANGSNLEIKTFQNACAEVGDGNYRHIRHFDKTTNEYKDYCVGLKGITLASMDENSSIKDNGKLVGFDDANNVAFIVNDAQKDVTEILEINDGIIDVPMAASFDDRGNVIIGPDGKPIYNQHSDTINNQSKEIVSLNEKKRALEQEIAKKKKELGLLETEKEQAESDLQNMTSKYDDANRLAEERQREIDDKNRKINQKDSKISDLEQTIRDNRNTISGKDREINEKQKQLERERNSHNSIVNEKNMQINQKQNTINWQNQQMTNKDNYIRSLSTEIQNLKRQQQDPSICTAQNLRALGYTNVSDGNYKLVTSSSNGSYVLANGGIPLSIAVSGSEEWSHSVPGHESWQAVRPFVYLDGNLVLWAKTDVRIGPGRHYIIRGNSSSEYISLTAVYGGDVSRMRSAISNGTKVTSYFKKV